MTTTDILFYVFSAIAVAHALVVVLGRNPITSAFALIVVFFCVAADYALLHAHFIAAIQILVYAGAIMVLFIFVIMLLNADVKNLDIAKKKNLAPIALVLCAAVAAMFYWSVAHGVFNAPKIGLTPDKIESMGGNVRVLSEVMFSDYILPFELTSILLLVGIVGSVALAKRKMDRSATK